MNDSDFNPYVRYVAQILEARPYPELICAYDHRMFFVEKGDLSVEFEDTVIALTAGDIITIPPATAYRLLFSSPESLLYYVINFDFDNSAYGTMAHTPQPAAHFDPAEVFSTACMPPFHTVFVQHEAGFLTSIIAEIYAESVKGNLFGQTDASLPPAPDSVFLMSALMKYILTRLASNNIRNSQTQDNPCTQLIAEVKKYVKKNACSAVSNNSVAKHFDYHPYYLNSLFAKQEGITLHRYILDVRFQKAKELLISTNKAIYAVAAECGFQSASYFSEAFLKHEGITPTQYREYSK